MEKEVSSQELRKTNVGTFGLIFQGMGQLAPIAIFAGAVTGAAAYAMGATPLAFIIGMLAALLSGNSVFQFSKKVAHAGGYAAYVNKGLGKHFAAFTGYIYILYELVGPGFIVLIYLWTFSGSINATFGTSLSNSVGIIYVAITLIAAFFVVFRGLKLSVTALTILGIIQLAIVFIISTVLVIKAPSRPIAPFTPIPMVGWHGLFLGFITGSYGAYAGYGSVVPLGEEVKSPHKSIGRAVLSIILIMAATYIYGSYAMISTWGLGNMSGFAASGYPGAILAGKYIDLAAEGIIIVLYNMVIFTPIVSQMTAGSRMIFSMSRQGLLPRSLAKVHRKFGTPSNAVILSIVIITIILSVDAAYFWFADGFSNGVFYAWIILAIMSSISTLIIHVLVNTSLTISNIKSFNVRQLLTHWVFPIAATAIIVVAIAYSLVGITMPIMIAPIGILVYSIGALLAMYFKNSEIKNLVFEEVAAAESS